MTIELALNVCWRKYLKAMYVIPLLSAASVNDPRPGTEPVCACVYVYRYLSFLWFHTLKEKRDPYLSVGLSVMHDPFLGTC